MAAPEVTPVLDAWAVAQRQFDIAAEESLEQVAVLHTGAADVEQFADQVAEATGVARDEIEVILTGPVAGAHVGPDMVGVTRILAG